MLVHFIAHLHSTCGPLGTEATEGSSQVLARTAAQLAMQVGSHGEACSQGLLYVMQLNFLGTEATGTCSSTAHSDGSHLRFESGAACMMKVRPTHLRPSTGEPARGLLQHLQRTRWVHTV